MIATMIPGKSLSTHDQQLPHYPHIENQAQPSMPLHILTPSTGVGASSHSHRTALVPYTPGSTPVASATPTSRIKRASMICSNCFDASLPCNGNWPSCSSCSRQGLTCAYATGVRKRGPRAGYSRYLSTRIQELGAQLKKKAAKTSPSMARHILDTLSKISDIDTDHDDSDNQNEAMARQSESPSLPPMATTTNSSSASTDSGRHQSISSHPHPTSPDTKSFRMHMVYQFLHHFNSRLSLFDDHILVDLFSSKLEGMTPFLGNIVCAIGAFVSGIAHSAPEPEHYYNVAKQNLQDVVLTPCLMNACGLFLFGVYAAGQGKRIDGEMAFIASLRMCQSLGFCREETMLALNLPEWQRELGRRLVWKLYEVDRIFSLQSGLPFASYIRDFSCRYPSFQGQSQQSQGVTGLEQIFPTHIAILSILSDIVSTLSTCSDVHKLQQIELPRLEGLLRHWFETLPPWMKHMASLYSPPPPPSSGPLLWQGYYSLVLYAFAYVCLYGKQMLRIVQQNPRHSCHHHPAFIACVTAANVMTRCLDQFAKYNPRMEWVPPFFDKCIFLGAVIHLLSLGSLETPMDRIQSSLAVHKQCLSSLAWIWLPSKSSLAVLELLIKGCESDFTNARGQNSQAGSSGDEYSVSTSSSIFDHSDQLETVFFKHLL